MLKDLRRKNKTKKTLEPDDIYEGKGISMVRFGRFVFMKNTMTSKQYKTFRKNAAEKYPEMCKEIDERVLRIRNLVKRFDPLQLMQCGYFHFAQSALGKASESEYGFDDIPIARMIDYIQSIIVSTPDCNIDETTFDENAWSELFNEVKKLYNILIPCFPIYRSLYYEAKKENYDASYDKFYTMAEMLWLSVRCDRYFIHDLPHLYDLLTPHDKIFQEIFGISIHTFLDGIEKIQISLSQGLGKVVEEMNELKQKVISVVDNIEGNASKNELQALIRESAKEEGWEDKRKSLAGRFFGFDLFDLQKITNLPNMLLRELSWEVGQDKEFFKDGEYKGWPLRLIPVKIRPFLKIKDKYYCFDLANLMDNIYRMIQRVINRLRPEYTETSRLSNS